MLNSSGIHPLEVHVLIKIDAVEEVTKGGIIRIKEDTDREEMANTRATLIAVGENAFVNWGRVPKAGERIMAGKYAGLKVVGDDGEDYRLCEDTDVRAILETNNA